MAGGTGIEFELRVEGDAALVGLLDRLQERNADMRVPLRLCSEALGRSVARTFSEQGVSEPGMTVRWKPLSAWTIAGRMRRKGRKAVGATGQSLTDKILVDTGRLKNSTVSATPGSFGIRQVSKFELLYGTKVDYAATHQFGRPRRIVMAKVKAFTRRKNASKRRTKKNLVTVSPFMRRMVQPAVPARPFLMVKPSDMATFVRILQNYENYLIGRKTGMLPDRGPA